MNERVKGTDGIVILNLLMPSLDMSGPFDFTSQETDRHVEPKRIGNYALGNMKDDGTTFLVKYVGRSDTDLNVELKARLDKPYRKFKFSYAGSVREAFDKECRNYHDFGGKGSLDNEVHPARPPGANWPCPVSGCTELQ
jgi:hypothetical protein